MTDTPDTLRAALVERRELALSRCKRWWGELAPLRDRATAAERSTLEAVFSELGDLARALSLTPTQEEERERVQRYIRAWQNEVAGLRRTIAQLRGDDAPTDEVSADG